MKLFVWLLHYMPLQAVSEDESLKYFHCQRLPLNFIWPSVAKMFIRDCGLQIWAVAIDHNFQKLLEVGPTLKDFIFWKKTHSAGIPWKAVLFSYVPTWAIRNWMAPKQRVFKRFQKDFDTGDLSHLGSRSLRLLRGRQDHLGFDFNIFFERN